MTPIIQFDVDGVLADFTAGFAHAAGAPHTSDLDQVEYGRYINIDDDLRKATWAKIVESPTFWCTLPRLVTLAELARVCALAARTPVYFVTSRVGKDVKRQTETWLYWMGVDAATVIVSPYKGQVARAVGATHAIEDKAGNAVYIAYESPATESFLVDRKYNQFNHGVLGSKVRRVASVGEFLDNVEAS